LQHSDRNFRSRSRARRRASIPKPSPSSVNVRRSRAWGPGRILMYNSTGPRKS